MKNHFSQLIRGDGLKRIKSFVQSNAVGVTTKRDTNIITYQKIHTKRIGLANTARRISRLKHPIKNTVHKSVNMSFMVRQERNRSIARTADYKSFRKGPNHKFCSSKCGYEFNRSKLTEKDKRESVEYQRKWKKKKKKKEEKTPPSDMLTKTSFVNFGDLVFWREKEFEEWFAHNYVLFGIKRLIKMDRMFPDVICETHDGKTIRVELEFSAPNFKAHGHDPTGCDLIISYLKHFGQDNVLGVSGNCSVQRTSLESRAL